MGRGCVGQSVSKESGKYGADVTSEVEHDGPEDECGVVVMSPVDVNRWRIVAARCEQ